MYVDAQLLFSDAQAVTTDAASTNLIDLGVARNLFDGEPLCVVITVDVAADATTGDETYEFQIETDDNSSFSSATDLIAHTIAPAALSLGSVHVLPIPVGAAVERYLRLNYNTSGTTPTVTVTAFLQPLSMYGKYKAYADNVTIS
jgi:hypothetical protein